MSSNPPLTVGEMVKRYGLSRSTLLYYDEIGLLKASRRSQANYRLYSTADMQRMERIMLLRSAGIALEAIKVILNEEHNAMVASFEQRLQQISIEKQALQRQQNILAELLKDESVRDHSQGMTKEKWTAMLSNAGLDDEGMREWHRQYEQHSPQGHQLFLQSLNIDKEEIDSIRQWSKSE